MESPARTLAGLSLLFAAACAQVPKESVELSATVGRDLLVLQDAHRATTALLFQRMIDDVDQFVDGTYAPYQIQKTLEQDRELAAAGGEDSEFTLHKALERASQPGADPVATQEVIDFMQTYVEEIRAEVESYRGKLLAPIEKQRREVMTNLDEAYARVHYANSIVTGHLASVMKVHDAQAAILATVGLESLREKSGAAFTRASRSLSEVLLAARKGEGSLDKVDDIVAKIQGALD